MDKRIIVVGLLAIGGYLVMKKLKRESEAAAAAQKSTINKILTGEPVTVQEVISSIPQGKVASPELAAKLDKLVQESRG